MYEYLHDVDPFVVGSEADRRKRAKQKMGLYDQRMRPSMGHKMQVELRESIQHYNGNKTQLQQQLAELCLDNRDLYTSPHPPSTTSSVSSIKRWQNPESKFNTAPEKAAQKARLAQQQDSVDSSRHVGHFEFLKKNNVLPSIQTPRARVQDKNTLVPPHARVEEEDGADSEKKKQREENNEKKALRFGANIELKTPVAKKTPRSCSKKRTKSALKEKPKTFQRLPTLHSAGKKRMLWDSGQNHVHQKGKSTDLETSRVKEDWQNFSRRSVNLPPIMDSRRVEINLPSIPKGLTKAKLQAANRLQKRAPVDVAYIRGAADEEDNIPGPSNTVAQDDYIFLPLPSSSKLPLELDDSTTLYTASDDEEEGGRTSDRLELPPLPVVRLTESKVGRHNLQPITRHVPRLRLDRASSPGLLSVGTGRSGATGATIMSLDTLEWKGEYMMCASRNRKNRMLSEIIQIVHQRMRDNEEDLKSMGHDPRPFDLRSEKDDDDVQFWDRLVDTPSSGATTGRSTRRRQRLKVRPAAAGGHGQKRTGKKQTVAAAAAGTAPSTNNQSGAKLHMYLQKLSQKRKAPERQRHQRDRVRFHMTNMTSIREITQSSIGHLSSAMHTSAPITPLAA